MVNDNKAIEGIHKLNELIDLYIEQGNTEECKKTCKNPSMCRFCVGTSIVQYLNDVKE